MQCAQIGHIAEASKMLSTWKDLNVTSLTRTIESAITGRFFRRCLKVRGGNAEGDIRMDYRYWQAKGALMRALGQLEGVAAGVDTIARGVVMGAVHAIEDNLCVLLQYVNVEANERPEGEFE